MMPSVSNGWPNTGAGSVTLAPYASVQRQGVPAELGRNQIVHEGAIGWLGGELRQLKYAKWLKEGGLNVSSVGGWTGITDAIAVSAAVEVAFTMAAALTLLPAVLSLLGPRVDSLRVPGRHPTGTTAISPRLAAWTDLV